MTTNTRPQPKFVEDGHSHYDCAPPLSDIPIIAWKANGDREQVTIRDGVAYVWNYDPPHNTKWCDVSEITLWRHCTGFDY